MGKHIRFRFLQVVVVFVIMGNWPAVLQADISKGKNCSSDISTDLYTSANSEVYAISKHIKWLDQDAEVYNYDGKVAYLVSYMTEDRHLFRKTSQFFLRSTLGKPGLSSDTAFGLCGFDHTYHTDNGLKIKFKTRAFLSDKWYLTADHLSGHSYVFNRNLRSIAGDILDKKTGRLVARISDKNTIGRPWAIQKFPSGDLYTLTSDGSIPACDLLALLIIAATRATHCQL